MLLDLLRDLDGQHDVELDVHVVECGDDGSLASAARRHSFRVVSPGENLGYCGGNNLVLREAVKSDAPICIINPDVHLPDLRALRSLYDTLQIHPDLAAVAPAIRTLDGYLEYTDSEIDLARAWIVHTGTHVIQWPADASALVEMPWIDGACWMLRPAAVREIGLLDERFFLCSEEVDWCLRAVTAGWKVGVFRGVEVGHRRSSSFATSSKGAYYAWRNTFLLCQKHSGHGTWILSWLRRLFHFPRKMENLKSGQTWAALRGARDAAMGREGRMAGDG